MATLPKEVTQEELDRLAQLSLGVRALQDELDKLTKHVKEALHSSGIAGSKTLVYPSKQYGSVILKIGEQRRLNKAAKESLAEAFPSQEHPQYWEYQINPAKIPALHTDPYRETVMTLSIDVEAVGIQTAKK